MAGTPEICVLYKTLYDDDADPPYLSNPQLSVFFKFLKLEHTHTHTHACTSYKSIKNDGEQ